MNTMQKISFRESFQADLLKEYHAFQLRANIQQYAEKRNFSIDNPLLLF